MRRSDSRPKSVMARAPASIANLGPGFDTHSIALKSPEIQIEFTLAPSGSRILQVEGAYAKEVTTDPQFHASAKALNAVFEQFRRPEGYILRIQVNIPPRKGLGLSGAEAVGAVLCADSAFGLGLSRETVARLAAKAEPQSHMDNVAASSLGGFNVITRTPLTEHVKITTISPPSDLGVVVLVPDINKPSTEAARELLPQTVSTQKYIQAIGYASRISAAFATGNVGAILETIPWDPLVEPVRADAGFYGTGIDSGFLKEEKELLIERFHVAETISGAGPSRALWYSIPEERKALGKNKIGLVKPAIDLVTDRLESHGHRVRKVFVTRPSPKGARIIRSAREPLDNAL